jgi:hypothetical protein
VRIADLSVGFEAETQADGIGFAADKAGMGMGQLAHG